MINLLVITRDDTLPGRWGRRLRNSGVKVHCCSPGPHLPDHLGRMLYPCVCIDNRLSHFSRYQDIVRDVSPLSATIALHDEATRQLAEEALQRGCWITLSVNAGTIELERIIHSAVEHQIVTDFGLTDCRPARVPADEQSASVFIGHLTQAVLLAQRMGLLEQSKLPEQLIAVFLGVLKNVLCCEKVSVLLPEDSREDVVIMLRDRGTSDSIPVTVRLKERGQVTSYLLRHAAPLLVEDIENDTRFHRSNKDYYHTPSFISVPLAVGNRILAIVNATDKCDKQAFLQTDLQCAVRLVDRMESAMAGPSTMPVNWMEQSFQVEQMTQKTSLLQGHLSRISQDLRNARIDLNQREAELSAIYTADEKIRETLVLEELLTMVTDLVVTVMSCDKSSVLLLGREGEPDILVRGSRRIIDDSGKQITKLDNRGKVTDHIMNTGNPLLITDDSKRADLFTDEADRYRTQSFVSVPVYLEERIVAIVNATDKISGEDFNSEDLKLLEFLASQISRSMEKFELTKHLVHAQQVEHELKIAAGLQKSILPRCFPQTDKIQVAAFYRPAREMGGDFYDAFKISDHRLGLLVADVTGKGIPAAFYSALVLSHVKALCARYRSPRTICRKTNAFLFDLDPESSMFVTMFLGLLDQRTGKLTFVSAGHEQPILRHGDGRVEKLDAKGLMLGIFKNCRQKQRTITLEPGDLLFIYTDGLTDAQDEDKNRLSRSDIETVLDKERPRSAQTAIDVVMKFVDRHIGNASQFDDITILTVNREA